MRQKIALFSLCSSLFLVESRAQSWNIPSSIASPVATGIGTVATPSADDFNILAGGIAVLRIQETGFVGIGINNPIGKLSLGAGAANTKLALYDNGTGTNVFGLGIGGNQLRFHLGTPFQGVFTFFDSPNGNELLNIYGNGSSVFNGTLTVNKAFNVANGNVGIGLSSTSTSSFLVSGSGSNPFFQFTGANSYNGATFSRVILGMATNVTTACTGCFSDVATTNDVIISAQSDAVAANLIIANHINNGSIKFSTKNNNSSLFNGDVKRMELTSDGKLVIGNNDANGNNDFTTNNTSTTFPSGYKLYVAKGILTPKIKTGVPSTAQWSDYVFAPDYQLRSIDELEKYIKSEKHLPGVPSAEEVVREGIDVALMDAKLLEKIEELSLYVIQLKKDHEKLAKQVNGKKR